MAAEGLVPVMLTTPEASSAEMSTPGAEMNAAWLDRREAGKSCVIRKAIILFGNTKPAHRPQGFDGYGQVAVKRLRLPAQIFDLI
jgi:hypothetical protein